MLLLKTAMNELFKPISRDERQLEAIKKWIANKGNASIVAGTGFGKTYVALKIIKLLKEKKPDLNTLVVVPTEALKNQWISELDKFGLTFNTDVQVMMGASKRKYKCDLLIIDEAHRINSEVIAHIFDNISYRWILGLTATFERLDGRHEILAKYAPVCDTISLEEAQDNGWISKCKDYVVLLNVDDINTYKGYNKEFQEHFGFFDYDFNIAMSLVGQNGFNNKKLYCNKICQNPDEWTETFKKINYHSTGFMRSMQLRKKFIANHPKKLEIAEKIIAARQDQKIITFCPNVAIAESFKEGFIYTGKEGKKKNKITLEEFSKLPSGILHTCKLAEEGISLCDLSVGIMLGVNSSKTKQIQTLGRILRLSEGKNAEFFTLMINNTAETEWVRKSRSSDNFEIIDEENLMHVLNYEPYETYKRAVQKLNFRY